MSGKISFVLPAYNGQATLALCLESLLDQSGLLEIIVINDGSIDNTERILSYYDMKYDEIIVKHNPKREGGAYCRNLGNFLAVGDYIAVCDTDYYYNNRGDAILNFFEDYPEKSVFYSAAHLRPYNNVTEKYMHEAYEWDFKSKCPISHPTVAYIKDVAKNVVYPRWTIDSDMYEFFLLDAHKKGYKFGGCADPLMLKTEGGSKRNSEKAKELKKQKYKEYGIDI